MSGGTSGYSVALVLRVESQSLLICKEDTKLVHIAGILKPQLLITLTRRKLSTRQTTNLTPLT